MNRRAVWLPLAVALTLLIWTLVAFAAGGKYARSDWKHWTDLPDHPCRSTRQAALFRDARPGTATWDDSGCRVEAGQWIEPYEAAGVVTDPKLLDVDHLIPLGFAHAHGGAAWSKDRKAAYANFLGYRFHLITASAHANRQKSDKGPSEWVPENIAFWCTYGSAWAVVAVVWKLDLPDEDRLAVRKLVETC
jgi:hypothetical protein